MKFLKNLNRHFNHPFNHLFNQMISLLCITSLTACTGQIPNAFRLSQQEETFSSQTAINTQIDILWVVDNSFGMDVSQQLLRQGFSSFANKYMKPTWDIQMGVITTDTFLAHPSFSTTSASTYYLMRKISGTTGWTSPYIAGRIGSWVNPSNGSPLSWVVPPRTTSLVNTTTNPGQFTNGIRYLELVPTWGPNFAKLLPGYHDGPIPGICSELLPYFFGGNTNCSYRDGSGAQTGPTECLNSTGTLSSSRCVNTIQNDTIRSGKGLIKTQPPAGVPADSVWSQQLLNDSLINLSTGSIGHGSERGFQSILQLITDNESVSSTTKLFRPGSVRAIIFVTNEDDQSVTIPSPGSVSSTFTPYTYYKCDQPSLLALNSSNPSLVTGSNGYCCTGAGCFIQNISGCTSKTVDGFTYTPSICPDSAQLISESSVKTQLDTFFQNLDSNPTGDPNYIVSGILAVNGSTIQSLHNDRIIIDQSLGQVVTFAIDRGDRYLNLINLVGGGSQALDIGATDYAPLLDSIGQAIIAKRSTYTLSKLPSGQEEMIVKIKKSNGSILILNNTQYSLSGYTLAITDLNLVLTLGIGDSVIISYQPISLG